MDTSSINQLSSFELQTFIYFESLSPDPRRMGSSKRLHNGNFPLKEGTFHWQSDVPVLTTQPKGVNIPNKLEYVEEIKQQFTGNIDETEVNLPAGSTSSTDTMANLPPEYVNFINYWFPPIPRKENDVSAVGEQDKVDMEEKFSKKAAAAMMSLTVSMGPSTVASPPQSTKLQKKTKRPKRRDIYKLVLCNGRTAKRNQQHKGKLEELKRLNCIASRRHYPRKARKILHQVKTHC